MKTSEKIITNQMNYIESIGKADRSGLMAAIQEEGSGTVIRVCLWRCTTDS